MMCSAQLETQVWQILILFCNLTEITIEANDITLMHSLSEICWNLADTADNHIDARWDH